MRLVTWNCNGAFRKKLELLESFSADLMIIQECEDPARVDYNDGARWSANCLWTGANRNKGLGVFARSGISLERLDWKSGRLRYFIPCRVNQAFDVVGVWCHQARTYSYIGQLWKYLKLHKGKMTNCLIAGDFNSNVFWDKPRRTWNHTDVVAVLEKMRIRSLYHDRFGEKQGEETQHTFYLYKDLSRAYHIDYAFASLSLGKGCSGLEVGKPSSWLAASDHMPIVFDI